jgi:hypothetical protein
MKYPGLSAPLCLGKLELRDRVVIAIGAEPGPPAGLARAVRQWFQATLDI